VEATCFSETAADSQRTAWHYKPEDGIVPNIAVRTLHPPSASLISVCLTMLSVTQFTNAEWFYEVNNELEKIWKETVVA
jgi:hypothetical protein